MSYDYYKFDYNTVFDQSVGSDNDTVDTGKHGSWSGDAKTTTTENANSNYFGYQNTFRSTSSGAFSSFNGFHVVFNWSSYGYNSTNGTFTNNIETAGKYGIHLNFSGTEANTNIFRNATNTNLFNLSDKYTFQNKVNGRYANLLIRKFKCFYI